MKLYQWLGSAVVLAAAVGCDQQVTQRDIDDEREDVIESREDVDEAITDYRDDVREESMDEREDIAEEQADLREEQQELAATKERQQFEATMEARLNDMDMQIDDLEDRAATAEGEEKVRLEGRLAEMETRYDQLENQLDELRAASGDVWSQMKVSTENTWEETKEFFDTEVEPDVENVNET